MKKITSIAAALTMATAFCGFCAGCAANIENDGRSHSEDPALAVSQAADPDYKVILNPGWYYNGSTKVLNTIEDTGVTPMTEAQAKGDADLHNGYFVENAYFASVSAGENLPKPTTTRSGVTFVGWTYAADGVVVTVDKMPSTLTEDLYLYAQWSVSGSNIPTPGPSPDDPIPVAGVAVNGKAMTENNTSEYGIEAEYMLTGVQLEMGTVLTFTLDGAEIMLAEVESSSSGITKTVPATTTKSGVFDLYLKKTTSGTWKLYGSRNSDPILAEDAVAGSVYLAGVIDSDDLTWNHWNDGLRVHKGIKATDNGNGTYTLTVDLTQGDDCKFVQYGNNVWQGSLSGGGSYISFSSSSNMSVKVTGRYTFTITVSGNNMSVSVTYES